MGLVNAKKPNLRCAQHQNQYIGFLILKALLKYTSLHQIEYSVGCQCKKETPCTRNSKLEDAEMTYSTNKEEMTAGFALLEGMETLFLINSCLVARITWPTYSSKLRSSYPKQARWQWYLEEYLLCGNIDWVHELDSHCAQQTMCGTRGYCQPHKK